MRGWKASWNYKEFCSVNWQTMKRNARGEGSGKLFQKKKKKKWDQSFNLHSTTDVTLKSQGSFAVFFLQWFRTVLAPVAKATPSPADSFSRAQGGPLQPPDFSKGSRSYPAKGGCRHSPALGPAALSHHQDRDATALHTATPTQIVSCSLQPNTNWGSHHRKTSRMGFQKLPGA